VSRKSSSPKIAVYTCVTGGKDEVQPLSSYEDGIDYFIFSDRDCGGISDFQAWRKVEVQRTMSREARWHKLHPHKILPEYEVSVWIDGNIDIRVQIKPLIKRWLRYANMAMFAHPEGRKCIYQEYKACKRLKKDDLKTMEQQIKRYRADGYPEGIGLSMTGVLVRRHNEPDVKKAMEGWWKEIENGSIRDQLSFNYVAWKQRLKYVEIQEYFLQRIFDIKRHLIVATRR